jgi:hypothetical protein
MSEHDSRQSEDANQVFVLFEKKKTKTLIWGDFAFRGEIVGAGNV